MGRARSFHSSYKRCLLKISLVLILVIQSACQSVPPSPAPASAMPAPTITPTVCPNASNPYPDPLSTASNSYPAPGCLPTASPRHAYPVPNPAASSTFFIPATRSSTSRPTPTPTLTPTPPLIIPPIASLTPTPISLTLANLLPAHSQYLSGLVADLGPDGSPAVAALSRGPIGLPFDSPDISQSEFHLSIQPLPTSTFEIPSPDPKATIKAEAVDLDKDGKRELVLRPNWNGSLVFQSTGLEAWPRLMDENGDIKFSGGKVEIGLNDTNLIDFNHAHSVLYYAGVKQAAIADVDGDGQYEVDISYSEEDGADTWQVLRYHWKDGQYQYTDEHFTRPAQEAVPPEQFLKWSKALEPLPEVIMGGKGDIQGPLAVKAVQVSRLDINHDGSLETLMVYRVSAQHQSANYFQTGAMAVAVFAPDDSLAWRSDYRTFAAASLEVSAEPVELSHGEMGFMYQWNALCMGGSEGCESRITLYHWDGYSILPVWERQTASETYGSHGYDHRQRKDTVWMEDIDRDGHQEIMLQTLDSLQDSEDGFGNYLLQLPGTRVYHWDGATYQLTYLFHDGILDRVRPSLPLVYAPYLGQTRALNWQWPNIRQLEYGRMPLASAALDQHGAPEMLFAWDQENLYIYFETDGFSSTRLAIDSNLTADFNDPSLSSDDFFLSVYVETEKTCSSLKVEDSRPGYLVNGVKYSMGLASSCVVELSIPLKSLGIDGVSHLSHPGWMTYGIHKQWQYMPAVERVLGFSVLRRDWRTDYLLQDKPTTWGTLVLMADR